MRFDRERDVSIPASWLKSHGRSLARYHLHQETKFWGGEYDQRGPLRRRHVSALSHLSIGNETDHIEESEYGEEVGPLEHPLAIKDRSDLAAFIFRPGGSIYSHIQESSQGRANIRQIAVPIGAGGGTVAPRNWAGRGGKRAMASKAARVSEPGGK
jgi:hypothetical protein